MYQRLEQESRQTSQYSYDQRDEYYKGLLFNVFLAPDKKSHEKRVGASLAVAVGIVFSRGGIPAIVFCAVHGRKILIIPPSEILMTDDGRLSDPAAWRPLVAT